MPTCWAGDNPQMEKERDDAVELLEEINNEGYVLTHITSAVINNIMFVYHVFEK